MKKKVTVTKELIICDECGEEIISVGNGKTFICEMTGKELCQDCASFITIVLCKEEYEKIKAKLKRWENEKKIKTTI